MASEIRRVISGTKMAHFFPKYKEEIKVAVVTNSTFSPTCNAVLKRMARRINKNAKIALSVFIDQLFHYYIVKFFSYFHSTLSPFFSLNKFAALSPPVPLT